MKMKILILPAFSLAVMLAGCQSPKEAGNDPQNPIESQKSSSAIHGDLGVGVESRNTSFIAPTRPPTGSN